MNPQRARLLAGITLLMGIALAMAGWAAEVTYQRGLGLEVPLNPPTGEGAALGAIHIHTDLSDGGGNLDDVVREASAAGLAFVAVTDHNRRLLPEGVRGVWRGNVLVIAGEERSTPEGHLLLLGLEHSPPGQDAAVLARQAREGGGLAVVAHPNHQRRGWQGEWPPGVAAEIWSGDTDLFEEWGRGGGNLWPALFLRVWGPDLAAAVIHDRPDTSLREWDAYLEKRQVVPGLAGADAHGLKLGTWPIIGYRAEMRQIINYVNLDAPLATDAETATTSLLTALAEGQSHILRPSRGVPPGIRFEAHHPTLGVVPMGQPALFEPGWRLHLDLGSAVANGYWVRVFCDGQPLSRSDVVGSTWEGEVERPGAYRLEVYPPDDSPRPWLYTQPIYLVAGGGSSIPAEPLPPLPLGEDDLDSGDIPP